MKYKLPEVQSELISLVDKGQLWIDNKKGEDPLAIGINNNQEQAIKLLNQAPIERLLKKNKKEETLLHIAARLNLPNAVQAILQRIKDSSGKSEVINQLFTRTKAGKTGWEYIYLPKHGISPSEDRIKMLQDVLDAIKGKLTETSRDAILNDINSRERKKRVKGGISKEYADKLRSIVKAIPIPKTS